MADERGLAYLGTGGLLRQALRENSEAGQAARPYLDAGRYVPDEIMFPLVADWLEKQQGGWILDGFPRNCVQAEALDRKLGEKNVSLCAVSLEVPHGELLRRSGGRIECERCHWVSSETNQSSTATICQKCGGRMVPRADDDSERFEKRYQEFREMTMPLITYYQQSARLIQVDGAQDPESVAQEIAAQLGGRKS